MKKSIILGLAIIACIFNACKKDTPSIAPPQQTQTTLSLDQVKDWYNGQPTLSTQSLQSFSIKKLSPNWPNAESFNTKNSNYWLITLSGQPTYQGIKQGYRKIAFLKDSTGTIMARILEIIPDAQYFQRKKMVHTKDFTGRIFIYNDHYQLLGGKIYASGKQVGLIKSRVTNSPLLQTQMLNAYTTCDWYDSSYIDAEGTFTIHSENICSTYIYDDGFNPDTNGGVGPTGGDPIGGGGGGGAPAASPPQIAELLEANNPAVNPKDFIKCFGNIPDAGATMTVTVYVQEPLPGTSFPYGTNGVGHTAIGLTKTGTGGSINQTLGFYPASASNALGGNSKLVDNGQVTKYNVSITYTVNADNFNKIANYIANPPTYDLYNFNCTNFAIAACQAAGIDLPNAQSVVGLNGVGGLAYSATPAGLGSSLDNMKGQSNVNTNGGTMPASHGACN